MLWLNRLLGIILGLVVVACGVGSGASDANLGSELKWGHLPVSAGGQKWLINVKPNEEIELCGSDTEILKAAIIQWAKEIGRGAIKVVDCNKGTAVKIKVNISTNYTQYPCTINGVQGATDPSSGQMYICSKLAAPKSYVIVHETGHLWGMCDMYPGQEQRCDTAHKTVVDNTAIMGNGNVKDNPELRPDDISGIKAMADRTEFAAVKQAWDAAGGTAPSTPSTTGDSSAGDIFLGLPASNSGQAQEVWIAAPTTVTMVKFCKGAKATCTVANAVTEPFAFDRVNGSVTTRNFFRNTQVPLTSYVGQITLLGYDISNKLVLASTVQVGAK